MCSCFCSSLPNIVSSRESPPPPYARSHSGAVKPRSAHSSSQRFMSGFGYFVLRPPQLPSRSPPGGRRATSAHWRRASCGCLRGRNRGRPSGCLRARVVRCGAPSNRAGTRATSGASGCARARVRYSRRVRISPEDLRRRLERADRQLMTLRRATRELRAMGRSIRSERNHGPRRPDRPGTGNR